MTVFFLLKENSRLNEFGEQTQWQVPLAAQSPEDALDYIERVGAAEWVMSSAPAVDELLHMCGEPSREMFGNISR